GPKDLPWLGELESGAEGDWVEFRPEGEHRWEHLGEGGGAAEIDRVVAEMNQRLAAQTPEQREAARAASAKEAEAQAARQQRALPTAPPDPDDPRLDWRNWTSGAYVPPAGKG
ncbi:MAG: hypothetical protein M3N07_05310, partial [Pseudomonadota bacterium]|nr:hypothetical protein [Pseudomonadota bacterium]